MKKMQLDTIGNLGIAFGLLALFGGIALMFHNPNMAAIANGQQLPELNLADASGTISMIGLFVTFGGVLLRGRKDW